jgi:hypothetical protein
MGDPGHEPIASMYFGYITEHGSFKRLLERAMEYGGNSNREGLGFHGWYGDY